MKLITIFILFLALAHAQDRTTAVPLKTIKEVHTGSVAEQVDRVKTARIAIMDYDLIRLDFPQTSQLSNPEIDEWILKQVAFISKSQVKQTVVNSPIEITGEVREAYRPPGYGRALVYEMTLDGQKIGLIDVKGSGALMPKQIDHGNGLSTLGEAIREYNYENLVRGVLIDAQLPNRTIGSYGVIDYGFDVIHADNSRSRAGLYLRQSHSRPSENGWLTTTQRDQYEKIFHSYGIDPNRNIQGTVKADIYDFGHFIVRDDLKDLDPKKAVDFNLWGHNKDVKPTGHDTRWFYSKQDRPWIWAHDTAEAFARGDATRDHIWKHHRDMVGPPLEKLKNRTVDVSAKSANVNCIQATLQSLLKKFYLTK